MKKINTFLFVSIQLLVNVAYSQETISIGEKHSFYSQILNENRDIQIHLPHGYEDESLSFPVMYVLDGEDNFLSAVSITKQKSSLLLHYPHMIIVGIQNADRVCDFSFDRDGGDHFLNFLENELIPHIDSNYRTVNHKILFGHSASANFGLHCITLSPQLFNGAILISPLVHHRKRFNDIKKNFPIADSTLKTRIFIGFAQDELLVNEFDSTSTYLQEQFSIIKGFKHEILNNEHHWSVPLIGMYHGLEFLYQGYKIPLQQLYKGNVDALFERIDSLSKALDYQVKYPEGALNFIAMEYLETHESGFMNNSTIFIDEALLLVEYNLTQYPKSPDSYSTLAYIYSIKEDWGLAKQMCHKALEFDPNHQMAHYILKQME